MTGNAARLGGESIIKDVTGTVPRWRLLYQPDGDIDLIRCDSSGVAQETVLNIDGATGTITANDLAIAAVLASLSISGNLSLTGASPTETIGAGTGSPTLILAKTDTGTATIDLYSGGEARGRIQLDANENTVIQPPAGAAAANGATTAVRGGIPGGGEGIGGSLNLQGADGVTATATSRAGGNVNVTPGAGVSSGSNGMLRVNGGFALVTTASPSALAAGSTDNYNPTGMGTANCLRLTPDAGGTSALSGIVPTAGGASGAGGRVLLICNIGAANLTLTHDATSTAANRFLCPGSVDLVIPANGARQLWYDTTSSRWRVLGAVA